MPFVMCVDWSVTQHHTYVRCKITVIHYLWSSNQNISQSPYCYFLLSRKWMFIWKSLPSGMWHHVWYISSDITDKPASFILGVFPILKVETAHFFKYCYLFSIPYWPFLSQNTWPSYWPPWEHQDLHRSRFDLMVPILFTSHTAALLVTLRMR
jgi:hypothetical protein